MNRPHCFSLSLVHGHLSSMDTNAMNICIQVSVCKYVFDEYPGVELPDHTVSICVNFLRNWNQFPKWLEHFTLLPTTDKSSGCSTFCPTICTVSLSNLSPCSISWWSWFAFPRSLMRFSIFQGFTGYNCVSFVDVSLKICCRFLSGVVCLLVIVVRVLCTFQIQIFHQTCALQIFAPSLWLVILFSYWCIWKNKNYQSSWSPIYQMFSLCLFKKSLPNLISLRFSPLFSTNSIVLSFTLGCKIHFSS